MTTNSARIRWSCCAALGAVLSCLSSVGCDSDEEGAPASAVADEKPQEATEDETAAPEVEMGGTLQIKGSLATDDEEKTLAVGSAFAYLVTDGDQTKLADIVLYNKEAEDVSCDTKIREFDDQKLIGGSHLALLLRGKNFKPVEFGEPQDIGDQYSPCIWYAADFGQGPRQQNGCGYTGLAMEDIQLTSVSKQQVEGTIDVQKSMGDGFIKGKFTAKVCPIVPLDEFLDR